MENWRAFQKRQLNEKLRTDVAKHNAAIKTALTNLEYIEQEIMPQVDSEAQFKLAQKALIGAQIQFMRIQLEAMYIE